METKKQVLRVMSITLMLSVIVPVYSQEYGAPSKARSAWSARMQAAQNMFRDALESVNIYDYWSLSDEQASLLAIFRNALARNESDKTIVYRLKRGDFYRDQKIMNNAAIMGAAVYMYYRGEPTDEQMAAFKKKFFPKRWWQRS